MAQRKTPPVAPGVIAGERVGPWSLDNLLRRDRLGEVYAGRGPQGAARVRICTRPADPAPLAAAVDRVAALRHPAVAAVLDQLSDAAGRLAVVTPGDPWTLADRRRRGRLDAASVGALGCVLLDGLAVLHAAGTSHGAVSSAAVGIDADGAPHWDDAGLLPALTGSRMAVGMRAAVDVAECAAMLRELGRLPAELEAILDPVASGVPGAIERAAPLAAAWRAALATLKLPTPPEGVRARIPGLLPPAPRAPRQRRPVPRWLRRTTAGLLVALALGVVPAAALGPGGQPLAERIDSYAPLRKGMVLTYRLATSRLSASITLRVTESKVIAGDWTATLESQSSLQGGGGALPLGLGGTTLRLHSGGVVRTAAGGSVRDLVLPLLPGATWRDRRTSDTGEVTTEVRTLLGPTALLVGAGSYDRCLAVALQSTSAVIGGSTSATGGGVLWYCPGVGLARAHLVANDEPLDVELISVK
jgi:hypothetical protein